MNSFSTFVEKKSFMHNLNPSLKLISVVFIIILIFLPIGFFGQLVTTIIVLALWFSSKLQWRTMKGIIKSILIMFVILFVIDWIAFKSPSFIYVDKLNYLGFNGDFNSLGNVLTSDDGKHFVYGFLWGGNVDLHVTTIKPTTDYVSIKLSDGTYYMGYTKTWYCLSSDVLFNTIYICLKIYLMITIVTILISTTTSIQLTFAIEDILNPLRYLKVPVNEWSMTIAIAIRFVPSLVSESQKILKAQASRGVDFSYGNIKDKIKAMVSLVVPMFSVAFFKADDLANAMEARAYNPRYQRTRYRTYAIKWYEWILFTTLSFILGMAIMFTAYSCVFAPFGWVEVQRIWG